MEDDEGNNSEVDNQNELVDSDETSSDESEIEDTTENNDSDDDDSVDDIDDQSEPDETEEKKTEPNQQMPIIDINSSEQLSMLSNVPMNSSSFLTEQQLNTGLQFPSSNGATSNGSVNPSGTNPGFVNDSDDEYEDVELDEIVERNDFFKKTTQHVKEVFDGELDTNGKCDLTSCIICNWDILMSDLVDVNGVECVVYERYPAIPRGAMRTFFNYIECGLRVGKLYKLCSKAHTHYLMYIRGPLNGSLKRELLRTKRSSVKKKYLPKLTPKQIYHCAMNHKKDFDRVLHKNFYLTDALADDIYNSGISKQHKTEINKITGKKTKRYDNTKLNQWKGLVRLELDIINTYVKKQQQAIVNTTVNTNIIT